MHNKTSKIEKISKIFSISLLLFSLLISTQSLRADDFYGEVCGNITCQADQTCQKTYRGVLPIDEPNPTATSFLESITDALLGTGGLDGVDIEPKWECVAPKRLEAPESPYKGGTGCLPRTTGTLLGRGLIFGGIPAIPLPTPDAQSLELLPSIPPQNRDFEIPPGTSEPARPMRLGGEPEGCTYNGINQVIDTSRLIAPLPVDLFNPLPLPVNVTSPNPLPVVVVDDLALYQQKELIDAPLAAQQKAKTIGIISDNLRYQVSKDNLIPDNYFAPTALGIQFGALDGQTGVVTKESIDMYGDYVNYDLATVDILTQWYKDRQEQKSNLPPETLTESCGDVTITEAGDKSFECGMLSLFSNNNPNDLYYIVKNESSSKSSRAISYIDNSLRDGRGYFPTTKDNNKNPFINQVLTPGADNQELAAKIMQSTIDQAIDGSGDNCYEALPQNILDGSLRPVLKDGLYGVSNSLAGTLTSDIGGSGGPVGSALTDVFTALGDTLLSNLTKGLSCEMTNSLSALLNALIGAIIG
ncbi:MAG: hypothetical protein RLZZ223_486 [Candidatus Parcubacteria bacterium]